MPKSLACLVAILASSSVARADLTVIYAPAGTPAPLVARPVAAEPVARLSSFRLLPPAPGLGPRASEVSPDRELAGAVAPAAFVRESAPEVAPAGPVPPATSARELATDVAPTPAATLVAPTTAPPTGQALEGASEGPCREPVLVVRDQERVRLPLVDCEGRADPGSVTELSLLGRPPALVTRPSAEELAEHASDPDWVAGGIRRLHPGLAERLRALADRFPGHTLEIVTGFRPDARSGSRHLHGLALDVRVSGASLTAVHAAVLHFDRTGVGLDPELGVVHLDVRERSIHWVDDESPPEEPLLASAGAAGAVAPADPAPARMPEVELAARAASAPVLVDEPGDAMTDEGSAEPVDGAAIAEEMARAFAALRLDLPPP